MPFITGAQAIWKKKEGPVCSKVSAHVSSEVKGSGSGWGRNEMVPIISNHPLQYGC